MRDNPGYDWEFLLVNDGSTDRTLQQMIRLHRDDPAHYSYVDLSRNYGKEIAMMAGFDYATGDALIIMDADRKATTTSTPSDRAATSRGSSERRRNGTTGCSSRSPTSPSSRTPATSACSTARASRH